MKRTGLLFVISAPSGGGKTTLSDRLLKKDPRLIRSVSATTREPRAGERDGVDYFFMREDAFQRQVRRRAFLEWAEVHDHCYGTPAPQVRKNQRAGRDVLLVIDVQGGLSVKRQDPRAVLIFIQPPSLKVLKARLEGRGTDSAETVRRRLQNARWEMSLAARYDYNVVNQNLAEAVAQVQAIITAERLRTEGRTGTRMKKPKRPEGL
jgi:guanylate kinase